MTTLEKEIIFAIAYRSPFSFDDIKTAYLRTNSFDSVLEGVTKAVVLGYTTLASYLDHIESKEIKSGRLLEE